jgi:hypothetical protein
MRLISPGHFVGEVELTDPGRYRLVTSGRDPRTTVEATFTFTIREAS